MIGPIDALTLCNACEIDTQHDGCPAGYCYECCPVHDAPPSCAWLVKVDEYDDGEPVIAECGRTDDLSEHDGLCPAHTRGESLEDHYAPGGTAWQDECREHGLPLF